jgi:phenylacetate-CoA ligase
MAFEDRLHASLGLYMQAPEWVRALGGRLYRTMPQRVRFGARHGRFLSDAQSAPRNIRWENIAWRLEASLHAAAAVPAHADHIQHLLNLRRDPLERLRELPLLTKADIKADLAAHLHPAFDAAQRLPTFTGGSTAEPMSFCLHRHVSRPKESAYLRHIEHHLLGALPTDWALSLRGRTVAGAGAPGERLWTTEPIKRHLLFSSDHLEPRFMPAYVQALERLRPPLIHAFPSALYPLARWLDQHPAPAWTEQVKGVLLTSENVYDFQTALLQRVFPNARIVTHYGHSERVLMAVAAGAEARTEFFPLYGLPELVDAQGRVIDEPGVLGEIVGTSFDNHVMPFLRYRTGDMGIWATAPRYGDRTVNTDAGSARFAMQRIEGRCQEFVVCADHRLVSITTLGAAHFHELSQVDRIQFEQRQPGRLTLKVVAFNGLRAADKLRMATAVRDKTQGGCEVDVEEVVCIERTARGKQRMLIQHLDLSHYLGAAVTPERERALVTQGEAIAA